MKNVCWGWEAKLFASPINFTLVMPLSLILYICSCSFVSSSYVELCFLDVIIVVIHCYNIGLLRLVCIHTFVTLLMYICIYHCRIKIKENFFNFHLEAYTYIYNYIYINYINIINEPNGLHSRPNIWSCRIYKWLAVFSEHNQNSILAKSKYILDFNVWNIC